MKNKLMYAALLLFTVFFACKNDAAKQPVAAQPVALETRKIEKKAGPDCDKPDSLIMSCVEIDLAYPTVKQDTGALKPAVEEWAMDYLTALVGYAEEPDNMPPLEEAIEGFIANHAEQAKEMPDIPARHSAVAWDTVLLNDGNHLTLRLDGFNFAGGAHPNPASAVATWEVATGKRVKLEDLVTDLAALQVIAEKKFRETRADLFKPESEGGYGFDFDEAVPFKLADNTGLVKDGIFFCYVPYEVGPYAMGGTDFVIPFSELAAIRK